jgi:hypothetical protein
LKVAWRYPKKLRGQLFHHKIETSLQNVSSFPMSFPHISKDENNFMKIDYENP